MGIVGWPYKPQPVVLKSPGSAVLQLQPTQLFIPALTRSRSSTCTMFAVKLAVAAFTALFAVGVNASPTGLVYRADWKDQYGWDGKVTTPVELDPKNAVKPTPGKPAPAAIGGVYFCKNANFVTPCVYVSGFNSGQCVGVGSDWNDVVSSFGPDQGLTCTIYSDANCVGRATGGVVYPGIYNLADYNNNDAMSSFRCTN
ncbi:hypothetical protein RhiJN_05829 [Ceratobasidium sp. AG-Ba]|nr:hypothetical protein RhiJN_05829 [Ceratobasidium sp. AG-Ba]